MAFVHIHTHKNRFFKRRILLHKHRFFQRLCCWGFQSQLLIWCFHDKLYTTQALISWLENLPTQHLSIPVPPWNDPGLQWKKWDRPSRPDVRKEIREGHAWPSPGHNPEAGAKLQSVILTICALCCKSDTCWEKHPSKLASSAWFSPSPVILPF